MAPRTKLGACHSQITNRLPHRANNSSHIDSNCKRCDYSETILHRLRPRVIPQGAPRIVRRFRVPLTYRKRTRPPVKRCSICKTKPCYRQSDKENSFARTMRIVSPRVTLPKTIESLETATDTPRSGVRLNSTSFIQSIRDYIASTFREGRRWVTKYLFRALKLEGESEVGAEGLRREGILQYAGSSSSSQIIRAGQQDFKSDKDKTRKRCKSKNHQVVDRSGCGTAVHPGSGSSAGNSPGEVNLGDLSVSNEKQRRYNAVNVSPGRRANDGSGNSRSKRRKPCSQSRTIRRKRVRRDAQMGRCSTRYKKVAKKVRELRSRPRENRLPISPKKLTERVMNNSIENSGNKYVNFLSKDEGHDLEDGTNVCDENKDLQKNIGIRFNESTPPAKDHRVQSVHKDRFSVTLREDCDSECAKMNMSTIRHGGSTTSCFN